MASNSKTRPPVPITIPPLEKHPAQALSPQVRGSPVQQRTRTGSSTLHPKASDVDYSRIPPDELFTKHSVAQIRNVYNSLRTEADGKQEELRLMVGERYRDLLQASASIIAIADSSQRVNRALAEVREACDTEVSSSRASTLPRKNAKDDSQLAVLQSLSAHLKLLLDAPEQLWRLLEHHKYLHAALLFLISRVVYRSLVKDSTATNDDEDDGEIVWTSQDIFVNEQFPLAQRQWDVINQFRYQIAHKATQDLRLHTRSPQEVCETLIAIILLNSTPLSETLSLLLSQRSRTLRTMFEKHSVASLSKPPNLSHSSPSRSRPPSPISADRLQNQELAAALLSPRSLSPVPQTIETPLSIRRKRRKEILKNVHEALSQVFIVVIGTLETVRDIFGEDETKDSEGQAMIERALELLQQLAPASTPTTAPSGINSGKRRFGHASKLSIISSFHATPAPLAFLNSSPSANPAASPSSTSFIPPPSTTTILESLPSSQLLLQFLPPSITSYAPYIDTTSSSAHISAQQTRETMTSWFNGVLGSLESKLRGWMAELDSVKEIWSVRNVLAGSEFHHRMTTTEKEALQRVMDGLCEERVRVICERRLKECEEEVGSVVEGVIKEIYNDETQQDPSVFMSTPIPLPAFASFGTSVPPAARPALTGASFASYRRALEHRITAYTPQLMNVLAPLEKLALKLRKDLDVIEKDGSSVALSKRLLAEYVPAATESCLRVCEILARKLQYGDHQASLFIGRLALELSASSSFLKDLCRSSEIPLKLVTPFREVYMTAQNRWQEEAVATALSAAGDHFGSSSSSKSSTPLPSLDTMRASSPLMQSLLSLISSIEKLVLPHTTLRDDRIPERLLSTFLSRALAETKNDALPLVQAQWDVAFIVKVLETFDNSTDEKWREQWENAKGRWASIQPNPQPFDPSSPETQTSLISQLERWQLLLGPLLGTSTSPAAPSSVSPATPTPSSRSASTTSLLLPFGTSSLQQQQHEFQPAVALAKPGPRFGLLLVGGSISSR